MRFLTIASLVSAALTTALTTAACTPPKPEVAVSATPQGPAPAATVAATASVMHLATRSPRPQHTPTAIPIPTATPALDVQAVGDAITAGRVAVETRGVDPLCLRWEDTDGDGEAEWLGLYVLPGEPPHLEAFVLDGEAWHTLQAPEQEERGLGTYPVCELDVHDVNADGRPEISIYGHAEGSVDLLHIFVWDGVLYSLLASFAGDAGVRTEDGDGDLVSEIVVRHDAGAGLAWEAVHTWDGATYGWTWERYDWLHRDRPHVYLSDTPEHAVIAFYLALGDGDLPAAYRLLSAAARSSQPYQSWAVGFDTTRDVQVGSVRQTARSGGTATVTAQVRSYDNIDAYIIGRLWDTIWTARAEEEGWRLEDATSDELDRWEVPFFP